MQRKQIAGWLMATVLVAGSGVALAEGGSSGSSLPDRANEHAVAAVAKEKGDTTSTTAGEAATTEGEPSKAGSDASTNDNHGAIVSAAAHDHSHDAECGNHGKYVSAVAHGETTCTTTTAGAEKAATPAKADKGKTHGSSGTHGS